MTGQRAAVGVHGGGQARQLVAAFQDRNHPALGVLVGDVEQDPRELLEILVRQPETAQRIAAAANRSPRK